MRLREKLDGNEPLKLLLAQDDMGRVGRLMAYHRVLQRDRLERIRSVRDTLSEIEAARARIDQTQSGLARTRAERETELASIAEGKAERQRVLDGIEARIASRGAEIRALEKDANALADLLESLKDIFADIPSGLDADLPFRERKGHLDWPVKGKLAQRFGATLDGGRSADGVVVSASSGSAVKAVAHGRVAFADWLRGFGLLLIVDHGEGFLSLYGHNESLLREVGDWVDAGETIATVGASGGRSDPSLYFELRHQGQPLDPRNWFARREP